MESKERTMAARGPPRPTANGDTDGAGGGESNWKVVHFTRGKIPIVYVLRDVHNTIEEGKKKKKENTSKVNFKIII